jgi:hypothetical protein
MQKKIATAVTLTALLTFTNGANASSFSNYSRTNTSTSIYSTLNSAESVSTESTRAPKETVLERETVCQDWVNRKNYLAVDLYGYLRLLTKETPFTSCTDFEKATRTDYPQALFIANSDTERIWSNQIPLLSRVAQACGTSEDNITSLSYQGIDLINGRPAETVQLSPAELYGSNYRRDTEKGVLRMTSRGVYTLPTGEKAIASEYSFDIFQWNTMMPKGSSGGWGDTPLFRLFTGKKKQGASSAPPRSPHTREYAEWFANNKPTRTACKFLLVDLTNAPRYQDEQSVTSNAEWRTAGSGLGPRGSLPK